MARVNIVGDGAGGLSAALFLAENGHNVKVFGQDETAINFAYLCNYLGIPEINGTEFQSIARQQVQRVGASMVDEEVTAASGSGPFMVHGVRRAGVRLPHPQ